MNIQQVMEKAYRDRHLGPAPKTEIAGRYEPDGDVNHFRLFMAEKRQEYIKQLGRLQRRVSVKKNCPLCRSYQAIIYSDHLILCPDTFPMYDYHMLIVPLKKGVVLDFELTNDSYRLACVTKDMLDCREYPIKEDIDAEVKLVQSTDYMVMQSMCGSGASVPEHIHAHAFKRSLMKFPLLKEDKFCKLSYTSTMNVMKIESPSYGFLIHGDSDQYGTIIDGFFKAVGLPFNLLITEFAQNVSILFFPRVREIPHDPIYEGWQFGVTEMLGLFEAKTHKQFNNLTYDRLCQGLQDTTVQDPVMRQQIENSLVQITSNLTYGG